MSKKATKKTTQVSIDRVCKTCAFHDGATGYCKRKNEPTPSLRYACDLFRTPQEWKAECEARRQERLQKEEQRLNFILTALYIQSTATIQMLEYFDTQFTDKKIESDWRFARKRAANEIDRCVQRIRDTWQHNFMTDQTAVMTKHGTRAFDVESYDNHEADARRWNLCLFHHMDTSWGDEDMEGKVLGFYEGLQHLGIFRPNDYRHFTTKR